MFWQENLSEEDMPPAWSWHLDDELKAWFEDVKRRHEERSDPRKADIEEPPLVKNPNVRKR